MAASPVFHIELRQFPHTARRFNLSREEIHGRFLGAWVRGQVVELDSQQFEPQRAKISIYEGRRLETAELGIGRGWQNAIRTGEEVTERELEGARTGATRADSAAGGLAALKDQLAALSEVAPVAIAQALSLASAASPAARVSERLAVAEQAVWELLHEGRVRLVRSGGEELAQGEWEPTLLATSTWTGQTVLLAPML
jgi:hypothetical protein